ncbi:uncharacterized protein LY79DRAFT_346189 [Colletotrichum navitas]|uniref:BED-type domain-containing protein n=1 Tax=Colletotrichum navitas TaxID=681940 RepID=A0AAD8V224_9PEZI|nr:uncharacterized protein LY79DRAFT_346189 [Colletotrichum navitas]KAK1579308.1 hypothetical protein LY79DRAFT_346189 [Colletotrichum navitas]
MLFDFESCPGYVWCKVHEEWYKLGQKFNRHKRRHARLDQCKRCGMRLPSPKERNEHYWRHHKQWAKEKKFPDPRRRCMVCRKKMSKASFIKRHLRRSHLCNMVLGDLPTESQTGMLSDSEKE